MQVRVLTSSGETITHTSIRKATVRQGHNLFLTLVGDPSPYTYKFVEWDHIVIAEEEGS